MIVENNQMDQDALNLEREKRMIVSISKEVIIIVIIYNLTN